MTRGGTLAELKIWMYCMMESIDEVIVLQLLLPRKSKQ